MTRLFALAVALLIIAPAAVKAVQIAAFEAVNYPQKEK